MKFISLFVGLLLALEYSLVHHPRFQVITAKPYDKGAVAEIEIEDESSSACDEDYDNCQIARGAPRSGTRAEIIVSL